MQFNPTESFHPDFFDHALIRTSKQSPTKLKFEVKTRHSNGLIHYLGKIWRWLRRPCTNMENVWEKMVENGVRIASSKSGCERLGLLRNLQNNMINFEAKVIQKHNQACLSVFRVLPEYSQRYGYARLVNQAVFVMNQWENESCQNYENNTVVGNSLTKSFERFSELRISYDHAAAILRQCPQKTFTPRTDFNRFRDRIVEKLLRDCANKLNNVVTGGEPNLGHARFVELQARAVVEICALYQVDRVEDLPIGVLTELRRLDNVEEIVQLHELVRAQNQQLEDTPYENRYQALVAMPGVNVLRCTNFGERCSNSMRSVVSRALAQRRILIEGIRNRQTAQIECEARRAAILNRDGRSQQPNNPPPSNVPPQSSVRVEDARLARQQLVSQQRDALRGVVYLDSWSNQNFTEAEIPNYRQRVQDRKVVNELLTALRSICDAVATNQPRDRIVALLRPFDALYGTLRNPDGSESNAADLDLAHITNVLVCERLTQAVLGLRFELNADVFENLELELAILQVQFSAFQDISSPVASHDEVDDVDIIIDDVDIIIDDGVNLEIIEDIEPVVDNHQLQIPESYLERARATLEKMEADHLDDYESFLADVANYADVRWSRQADAITLKKDWSSVGYLPAPFKDFCGRLDGIMKFLGTDESHPSVSQNLVWLYQTFTPERLAEISQVSVERIAEACELTRRVVAAYSQPTQMDIEKALYLMVTTPSTNAQARIAYIRDLSRQPSNGSNLSNAERDRLLHEARGRVLADPLARLLQDEAAARELLLIKRCQQSLVAAPQLLQDAAYLFVIAEHISRADDELIGEEARNRYKKGLEFIAKGYCLGFNPQTLSVDTWERIADGFYRTKNIPQRHYFADRATLTRPDGSLWNPETSKPLLPGDIEEVPNVIVEFVEEFNDVFPDVVI